MVIGMKKSLCTAILVCCMCFAACSAQEQKNADTAEKTEVSDVADRKAAEKADTTGNTGNITAGTDGQSDEETASTEANSSDKTGSTAEDTGSNAEEAGATENVDGTGLGVADNPDITAEETGGTTDITGEAGDAGITSSDADGQPAESAFAEASPEREDEVIEWNSEWEFAEYSKLHADSVTLYRSHAETLKNRVIAVNAGHGTSGGNKVKTLCHPDGTPKVTGGSTAAGELKAAAVSWGTTFLDGTAEYEANLTLAMLLKDILLEKGYDVLMIRQNNDTQLDNIARTVFSNNNADCHIALHYDSSESDKGFFYIGVPNIKSYRAMYPVSEHWQQHNAFGEAL